jgi:hypothetical protein
MQPHESGGAGVVHAEPGRGGTEDAVPVPQLGADSSPPSLVECHDVCLDPVSSQEPAPVARAPLRAIECSHAGQVWPGHPVLRRQ